MACMVGHSNAIIKTLLIAISPQPGSFHTMERSLNMDPSTIHVTFIPHNPYMLTPLLRAYNMHYCSFAARSPSSHPSEVFQSHADQLWPCFSDSHPLQSLRHASHSRLRAVRGSLATNTFPLRTDQRCFKRKLSGSQLRLKARIDQVDRQLATPTFVLGSTLT